MRTYLDSRQRNTRAAHAALLVHLLGVCGHCLRRRRQGRLLGLLGALGLLAQPQTAQNDNGADDQNAGAAQEEPEKKHGEGVHVSIVGGGGRRDGRVDSAEASAVLAGIGAGARRS